MTAPENDDPGTAISWLNDKLYNWVLRWFDRDWWAYLLAPKGEDYSWREVIWCRMRGHPAGEVFYNLDPYNLEPDHTCNGCGDDLG